MSRLAQLIGFPRIEPPYGAKAETQSKANESATDHPLDDYHLDRLGATETNPDSHLLYSHCLRSQIRPENLRRMRVNDLRYIASHSGVVYAYDEEGNLREGFAEKLRANAHRAELELDRRHRWAVGIWTTLIAAIGGVIGGLIVAAQAT